MAMLEGRITVYESSDGGSGDFAKTHWQFFVDPGQAPVPVGTNNPALAETVRLAIASSSKVRVTFDEQHTLTQVRIAFA